MEVRAAVWLNNYKILVYDKRASSFKTIEFVGKLFVLPVTTTTTTTYHHHSKYYQYYHH